jgi:hypothetical protein
LLYNRFISSSEASLSQYCSLKDLSILQQVSLQINNADIETGSSSEYQVHTKFIMQNSVPKR